MLILTIRTDNPQAEVGVFDDYKQLGYQTWEAHRQLSDTLHRTIENVLERIGKHLHDVQGIVCFKGPGSFTGLRIGLTVSNTLAYALKVPIVGTTGDDWKESGFAKLLDGENEQEVMPEYGAEANISIQKK